MKPSPILNNDQMRQLFTQVMNAMVRAGWLLRFTYTDGKGFHLDWSAPGAQRVILLERIISAYGLANDDRAPMAFYKLTQGEGLPDGISAVVEVEAEVLVFWRQCIEELGLGTEGDGLQVLVHIINGWAPNDKTPIVEKS
jgi:hypothetical protein